MDVQNPKLNSLVPEAKLRNRNSSDPPKDQPMARHQPIQYSIAILSLTRTHLLCLGHILNLELRQAMVAASCLVLKSHQTKVPNLFFFFLCAEY